MYIYLVRHGETEQSGEEIFSGKKNIALSKIGRKQAGKIGQYFADKHIGRIIPSPLARARHTAREIGRATNIPVEEVEEFSDMSLGTWEGLTLEEVQRRYPQTFETWRSAPHMLSLTAGESLADVRKRIAKALTGH